MFRYSCLHFPLSLDSWKGNENMWSLTMTMRKGARSWVAAGLGKSSSGAEGTPCLFTGPWWQCVSFVLASGAGSFVAFRKALGNQATSQLLDAGFRQTSLGFPHTLDQQPWLSSFPHPLPRGLGRVSLYNPKHKKNLVLLPFLGSRAICSSS